MIDSKEAIRLAAVRALREILAVLSRSAQPPQIRITRAVSVARKALARHDSYRRRAARRRYGARGVDHGQARRAEWILSALEARRPINITSIARSLRITERTAYRDLTYLRERGVAVRCERGTYRL